MGSSRLCEGFAPTRPGAPPSRRKCPGPRTSRDGESAPQILGYLRFLLNWANVVAKVPRRFWGTKRAAQRARRSVRGGAGISATEGAR